MAREVLNLEVYCPWSGVVLGGRRVKPHKMQVLRCENGTLFAICREHVTRIFVGSTQVISMVASEYKVVHVQERLNESKRRERPHAAQA